jgi:hypothetical protein
VHDLQRYVESVHVPLLHQVYVVVVVESTRRELVPPPSAQHFSFQGKSQNTGDWWTRDSCRAPRCVFEAAWASPPSPRAAPLSRLALGGSAGRTAVRQPVTTLPFSLTNTRARTQMQAICGLGNMTGTPRSTTLSFSTAPWNRSCRSSRHHSPSCPLCGWARGPSPTCAGARQTRSTTKFARRSWCIRRTRRC